MIEFIKQLLNNNKRNAIASCGDSFSVGYGLDPQDQFDLTYSGVLAKKYNFNHSVYGRAGCCNFIIYLQVKKVLEKVSKSLSYRPLIIISKTWNNRITYTFDNKNITPDLSQVDYLSYEPWKYKKDQLPFSIKNTRIISETLPTLINGKWFTDTGLEYITEKKNLTEDEKNLILELYDHGIKRELDDSLFYNIHFLCEHYKVPYILIGKDLPKFLPKINKVEISWEDLAENHPDKQGTGHCSVQGHQIVANKLVSHIERYDILS